jgi:hypothetical protein
MIDGRAGCIAALAAALMLGLAPRAEPAALPEGNPTGWALLSPCDRNCSVAIYAGSLVEDGMEEVLLPLPTIPTDWSYAADDHFVGLAVSRHAASWRRLSFEPELGVGQRLDQDVTEFWAALFVRYRGFPWDRYLLTSFAVSTGANIASDYSEWEVDRTSMEQGYRVMHYFAPEITFALPSRPDTELLFRFHHRSGAFGLFNDVGGGAQYTTVGLRFRF